MLVNYKKEREMPKVAINRQWGGFSLSEEAVFALAAKKGLSLYVDNKYSFPMYFTSEEFTDESHFDDRPENRADPDLISVIEELGSERASGRHAYIVIVDVPDDVEWHIHDYDGMESVRENHRSWA
jgi:hypothetical protein